MPIECDAPSSSTTTKTTSRFGARAALSALALALVALPGALILLLVKEQWAPLVRADGGLRDSLHRIALAHNGFVNAMQLVSDLGSALAWQVILTPVVLWLLWHRLPRLALFVVVTAVGSSLLNTVVKAAVHRPRPVLADPVAHAPGLSFPSGHAQAAMVGYAILLVVFLPALHGIWRTVAVTSALFMVLAIGFSRIALGVHYLSDVVGGFVLGAAWVAAMAAAFDAVRADRGRRPVKLREGLKPEHAPPIGGDGASEQTKGTR